MAILELIHANDPDLLGRDVFIRVKTNGVSFGARYQDDS